MDGAYVSVSCNFNVNVKNLSNIFPILHFNLSLEIQSTEPPFDLLIIGSKTTPFFDHRRGHIINNNTMLLCDFTNDFLCLWGPESGRWGIIQEGSLHISRKFYFPNSTVRYGVIV